MLKLVLPKGSLEKATLELFDAADLRVRRDSSVDYKATVATVTCPGATTGGHDVDLAAYRAANPSLITVSLSPFGGDGPKADWAATDLTLVAASGEMIVETPRLRLREFVICVQTVRGFD